MKKLLDKCFIKEESFFPKVLGGKTEIKIRQLTAGEGIEYQSILRNKEATQEEAIYFAVKCSMVEPKFFTDAELKKINSTGKNLIEEIHFQIAQIGMTKAEKTEYENKFKELVENLTKSVEVEKEVTKKEIEKK